MAAVVAKTGMFKVLQRGLGIDAEECAGTIIPTTAPDVLQRGLGIDAEE